MKFIMSANSEPHSSNRWFPGFIEGAEFDAKTIDDAQEILNLLCEKSGTTADRNYLDNGPIAIANIIDN